MSKHLNKAILIGRLGGDPEVRQGNKTEIANFSIADVGSFNGEEKVQWHRISAFGKQALMCQKRLHKGDVACIEGYLSAKTYEKNGEKRTYHAIVAERVSLLIPKRRPDSPPVSENQNTNLDEALF